MKIDRVFAWVMVLCTLINFGALLWHYSLPPPRTMSNVELQHCLHLAAHFLLDDLSDPNVREILEANCTLNGCLPWNVETVLDQVRPLQRR